MDLQYLVRFFVVRSTVPTKPYALPMELQSNATQSKVIVSYLQSFPSRSRCTDPGWHSQGSCQQASQLPQATGS